MKRMTVFFMIFAILASLCGCSDNKKAEGKVLNDNDISSSIGVEAGN